MMLVIALGRKPGSTSPPSLNIATPCATVPFDSAELEALHDKLVRAGATMRPGPGAANIGITPSVYVARVKVIDDLRAQVAALLNVSSEGAPRGE